MHVSLQQHYQITRVTDHENKTSACLENMDTVRHPIQKLKNISQIIGEGIHNMQTQNGLK